MIPSTTALVKKGDFSLTPIKTHKKYIITSTDVETTSSGFTLHEGYYSKQPTAIGADKANNDPRNITDNSYKHIIWNSINHRYYKHPYDLGKTFEGYNNRYIHKTLYPSCSILSIPYMKYGEKILPKSVNLTVLPNELNIQIKDDGYGNLYRVDYEESGTFIPRKNIVGYWGFNSEFTNFKSNTDKLISGNYNFQSGQFSNGTSVVSNIQYVPGVASGSEGNYGLGIKTNGTSSFVLTPDRPEFNFDNSDEFNISFWVYSSNDTGYKPLITKRGTKFTNNLGVNPKTVGSGQVTDSLHVSSSYIDTYVDMSNPYGVYPYEFVMIDSDVEFRRCDGIKLFSLAATTIPNQWNHFSVTRFWDSIDNCFRIALFFNGVLWDTDIDPTDNPINTNAILFGNYNQLPFPSNDFEYAPVIMDEIYICNSSFYSGDNNGITSSSFHTNLNSQISIYNTPIVGNVFYRQGVIVLNQRDETDFTALLNYPFNLEYKGTHTIYQYDVLCRIKKGDFNLSLNPSARKSAKSDMILDDMTGSLLAPYATSIGLYNDKNELLVIGKLGQAIQMREDVDINIVVRWDI